MQHLVKTFFRSVYMQLNISFLYQIRSNIEAQRNTDGWNLGREKVRLDPTSNVIAGGFGK